MREYHPNDPNRLEQLPDSETDCLRCQVRMKDSGRLTIHHGPFWRSLIQLGLAPAHRSGFNLRICPKCGTVEMYV